MRENLRAQTFDWNPNWTTLVNLYLIIHFMHIFMNSPIFGDDWFDQDACGLDFWDWYTSVNVNENIQFS